jgi:D-aminopeptidase
MKLLMNNILIFILVIFLIALYSTSMGQDKRAGDYGIEIGIFETGNNNSITDVAGVKVGHVTLIKGDSVRTGVTAVLPHGGNIFQEKVPAAIYIGNGFGKLAGYSQVEELGNLETPVILTNTLSVPVASDALITYTLSLTENAGVRSVNSVVGETNDGSLNNIRGRHVTESHVIDAINNSVSGKVEEGSVGAGTGTICFGFKGGIGTASRVVPEELGGFTVGVLVQTNFGGILEINGVPVGVELDKYSFSKYTGEAEEGSCMIVVATDAPLDSRNLKRLAKRAIIGMGKTGGIASNGSGDYVIAFSTNENVRVAYNDSTMYYKTKLLRNEYMNSLFLSVIEATEEAIINSLFAAETVKGKGGLTVESLPVNQVLSIMKKYNKLKR